MDNHPLQIENTYIYPWLNKQCIAVDLGCGNGVNTRVLARKCARVVGVDKVIPKSRETNIIWVQQDVRSWVASLGPHVMMDYVQMKLLLHFLPKDDAVPMLATLGTHIKPGGRVYVATWNEQVGGGFPLGFRSGGQFHPWTFFSCDEISALFPGWKQIYARPITRKGKGRHAAGQFTFKTSCVVLERPKP